MKFNSQRNNLQDFWTAYKKRLHLTLAMVARCEILVVVRCLPTWMEILLEGCLCWSVFSRAIAGPPCACAAHCRCAVVGDGHTSHYTYSTSVSTSLHIRGTWFLGHKRLGANCQENVYGFGEQELHAQTLLHTSLKWLNKAHAVSEGELRAHLCSQASDTLVASAKCFILIKLRTERRIYTQILKRDWCPWKVATII